MKKMSTEGTKQVLPFKAGKLRGFFESWDEQDGGHLIDLQQLQSKLSAMVLRGGGNPENTNLDNVKFFIFKPLPKDAGNPGSRGNGAREAGVREAGARAIYTGVQNGVRGFNTRTCLNDVGKSQSQIKKVIMGAPFFFFSVQND